jgi:hypothetical protein
MVLARTSARRNRSGARFDRKRHQNLPSVRWRGGESGLERPCGMRRQLAAAALIGPAVECRAFCTFDRERDRRHPDGLACLVADLARHDQDLSVPLASDIRPDPDKLQPNQVHRKPDHREHGRAFGHDADDGRPEYDPERHCERQADGQRERAPVAAGRPSIPGASGCGRLLRLPRPLCLGICLLGDLLGPDEPSLATGCAADNSARRADPFGADRVFACAGGADNEHDVSIRARGRGTSRTLRQDG